MRPEDIKEARDVTNGRIAANWSKVVASVDVLVKNLTHGLWLTVVEASVNDDSMELGINPNTQMFVGGSTSSLKDYKRLGL